MVIFHSYVSLPEGTSMYNGHWVIEQRRGGSEVLLVVVALVGKPSVAGAEPVAASQLESVARHSSAIPCGNQIQRVGQVQCHCEQPRIWWLGLTENGGYSKIEYMEDTRNG